MVVEGLLERCRWTWNSGWLLLGTASIAVVALIKATGGLGSDFLPLITLPIVLAVARGGFERIVAVGLLMTCAYIFVLPPGGPGSLAAHDAVQAVLLNVVAMVGALYVRQAHRERERLLAAVREKEALLNVSQIINAADRLEPAVNSTLLMLHSLVPGFRCAALFLADEARRFLLLADVIGAEPADLKYGRLAMRGNAAFWPPGNEGPLYVPDVELQRDVRMADLDAQARSIVCVRLNALEETIGLLYVASPAPNGFTADQVRLIQAFGDRIGFPLERLRVQEDLQGLAYTDGMTGLYNFRYFRAHLKDEIKRSARYHRPLSLIILDLDDFKSVNDRYGHPAGDRVLADLAALLRRSLRETDLPARYGGEEFVIICPETNAEEARAVAERVRISVEAVRFAAGADVQVEVTASLGIATYPTDARGEATLIEMADSALYLAKRMGKNRVILAGGIRDGSGAE